VPTPVAGVGTDLTPAAFFERRAKSRHLQDRLNPVLCSWSGKSAGVGPSVAESISGRLGMGRKGRNVVVLPFLAPALILYTAFLVVPGLQAFYVSLTDWSGFGASTFIGLKNFVELANDSEFYNAAGHNLYILFAGGIATLGLALIFAVIIWQGPIRGRGFFRVLLFSPSVVAPVAIAVTWSFVYNPTFGLLNAFLRAVGLGDLARPWLGDLESALTWLLVVMVWSGVGYYMVLFLAGLSRLPQDLYDAAKVDGAGPLATLTNLTMPLMRDVTITLVGLYVIGSFRAFDLIWIMTGGGPANSTDVVATYMYRTALGVVRFSTVQRMGYGTAVAVVLFAIILVATVVSQQVGRGERLEY
jgi:ABC-type sugar transport system permease subunit